MSPGPPSAAATVYDSATRRSPALAEIGELVRYRDLLKLLVSKIVKTRYKRSALGVAWTLLNPLLNMAVMTVAFSAVFRSTVAHYPVYVLTGLLWWNFFTQTTTYAISSLVFGGGGLLKRVRVPHTIFAVASVAHGIINLAISLMTLAAIMLVTGHPFHSTWWFLPAPVLLLALFSLGVALFISAIAVFFFDVVDIFQVVLQAWFFLTPIIYPMEIFPARYEWVLLLNPVHYLLETFRAPLLRGTLPDPGTFGLAVLSSLGVLLLGWWTFTRKSDQFAYRL
jgi:homopolymeric O-antigen transport system permease protein